MVGKITKKYSVGFLDIVLICPESALRRQAFASIAPNSHSSYSGPYSGPQKVGTRIKEN